VNATDLAEQVPVHVHRDKKVLAAGFHVKNYTQPLRAPGVPLGDPFAVSGVQVNLHSASDSPLRHFRA
jgi:hypothetical protein